MTAPNAHDEGTKQCPSCGGKGLVEILPGCGWKMCGDLSHTPARPTDIAGDKVREAIDADHPLALYTNGRGAWSEWPDFSNGTEWRAVPRIVWEQITTERGAMQPIYHANAGGETKGG